MAVNNRLRTIVPAMPSAPDKTCLLTRHAPSSVQNMPAVSGMPRHRAVSTPMLARRRQAGLAVKFL